MAELVVQMEELQHDILPRLCTFTDNPILLVEESHTIGDRGYLFRKDNTKKVWIETGMHCSSYYGFLGTVRNTGIDVVCTRNLDQSLWYMVSMHGYLASNHYPRHAKSFKPEQQAMGILCCIPGIGEKRAEKVLATHSIADLLTCGQVDGLTGKQLQKVQKVLRYKP